ncbi:MAG: 2TM domain-containing protein [Acidimicrobiia bacterium]
MAVIIMDTDLIAPSEATVENPEDQAYRQARERAEMIQGLYIHSLVFAVINAGLFAINWVTRSDNGSWWFQWPLLIWGTALIVHALVTVAPVFSPEWVEQRAQQILSRKDG